MEINLAIGTQLQYYSVKNPRQTNDPYTHDYVRVLKLLKGINLLMGYTQACQLAIYHKNICTYEHIYVSSKL